MADTSFFSRLQKLFSTSSIIRDPKTNAIKVVDVNNIQSMNNYESNRAVDNFTGVRSTSTMGMGYDPSYGFQLLKTDLYRDYEAMDGDSILASALDIYADESTMRNEYGEMLKITSDSEPIRETLYNLFYDVLNIEFNMWPWVRNLTKYGDMYLKLDIVESIGITNVIPLSPYYVTREESAQNPEDILFRYEASDGIYIPDRRGKRVFENYEIAHFRLLSDTNFLPYGKSMLEAARKVWGQLTLMEDAMMIHRIMRAPQKRVFKIDIGAIPPNEVDTYMNTVIDKMKKVPYMDEATGNYNLKFNLQNMLEDFYLPVRGGQSGTEISDLGGMEWTGTEDIEYLRNRMMAALKIPKAFLGYEEEINAKATLAAEDVRFARTIDRIQRIIISELTKIAIVHLYSQGYDDMDLVNFKLELTTASTVYDLERLELWSRKFGIARDARDLKLVSDEWLYSNIFDFSDEQIETERNKIIADTKRAFRLTQIADEGNDPTVTSESFGTKHDLAIVSNAKSAGVHDDDEYDAQKIDARTKTMSTAARDFADKSMTHTDAPGTKFKGGSPLRQEVVDSRLRKAGLLKSYTDRKKRVIKETFDIVEQNIVKDDDFGTFLDASDMSNDKN